MTDVTTKTMAFNGRTLTLHHQAKSHWNFLRYKSSCTTWVTDETGARVKVDKLTAHLVHRPTYGKKSKTRYNVSRVTTKYRMTGFNVPNDSVRGSRGCAEQDDQRWCSTD